MQSFVSNQAILQQQVDNLYSKIKTLKYNNTNAIMQVLSEAERLSLQYPDNAEILIMQVHLQIMNSQEQKARAIANHAWEIGGNLRTVYEKMYVNDLINLGMSEMAGILLRPHFENLQQDIRVFPLEMVRFALMTGSADLLSRVVGTLPNNPLFEALQQFVRTYQNLRYTTHFANMQKLVMDNVGNQICGYDFNCYTDRGFTDVEIVLYFSNYDFDLKQHKENINSILNRYCSSAGVKRIYNLSYVCKNIKDFQMF